MLIHNELENSGSYSISCRILSSFYRDEDASEGKPFTYKTMYQEKQE